MASSISSRQPMQHVRLPIGPMLSAVAVVQPTRVHLASQSCCQRFFGGVQKTVRAVGRFFYRGYAYVRLFFRAYASMGRGTTQAGIDDRIRRLNDFCRRVETCGNERTAILAQYNDAAFADARRVLFVVTPSLMTQFFQAQGNYPEWSKQAAADIVLDCRRAVSLQDSFRPVNRWYHAFAARRPISSSTTTRIPDDTTGWRGQTRNHRQQFPVRFTNSPQGRIPLRQGEIPSKNGKFLRDGHLGLYEACQKGFLADVRTLLRWEEEIDVPNSEGRTALQIACANGHLEIVKVLLNAGALLAPGTEESLLTPNTLAWIRQLETARDYRNEKTRPVFVGRILSVIQFATENAAFREYYSPSIVAASGSCVDGAHLTLNRLEAKRRLMQIPDLFTARGVQEMRGFVALDLLEGIAQERVNEFQRHRIRPDLVEIFLHYQVSLRREFNLPVTCENMNFASSLNGRDISNARDEIRAVLDAPDRFAASLANHEEWRQRIEEHPDLEQMRVVEEARDRLALQENLQSLDESDCYPGDPGYAELATRIEAERREIEGSWRRRVTENILDNIREGRSPFALDGPSQSLVAD